MPSVKLRGSIKAILQRRALGRSNAATKAANSEKSALLAYEAAVIANGNLFEKNTSVNSDIAGERKKCSTSHVSFEMRGINRTCTTDELNGKWYISWCLEGNELSPSTVVFNVGHAHHKAPSDYEIRFYMFLKNYGLLLYKKKLIRIQDADHHTVSISCPCPELYSTQKVNWSDVLVSGDIVHRKAGNVYMDDMKSHSSFLMPDRPHDRILIVGGHRFYVQSVYLAAWSRFFDRLFFGPFRESHQREIVIRDINPKAFLDLLLTIHPRMNSAINEKNLEHLLMLANYFDMPSVASMCSSWLSNFDDCKGVFVIDRLEIADNFQLKGLLNECCRYLLAHNDKLETFVASNESGNSSTFSQTHSIFVSVVLQLVNMSMNSSPLNFIETYAKDHPEQLFIFWNATLDLELACAVSAYSDHMMMVVEKFDWNSINHLPQPLKCDTVFVGEARKQKSFTCITFAANLVSVVENMMSFRTFDQFDEALLSSTKNITRRMIHVLTYGLKTNLFGKFRCTKWLVPQSLFMVDDVGNLVVFFSNSISELPVFFLLFTKVQNLLQLVNMVDTPTHFIETYAKDHPEQLFVFWNATLDLELARAVSAYSDHMMMVIEKFDWKIIHHLPQPVQCDIIFVGEGEVQQPFVCVQFGIKLFSVGEYQMLFHTYGKLDDAIKSCARRSSKVALHVILYGMKTYMFDKFDSFCTLNPNSEYMIDNAGNSVRRPQ